MRARAVHETIDVDGAAVSITGSIDPAYGNVRAAFVENFARFGEVGARVAVLRDGETLVDLYGGHTNARRDREWDAHTLVCCMSVTKGVVALAAHLLADRGRLDLDAPVARYWPEFAQNGKAAITVRQALSHQASLGIIDSANPGDMLDWDLFTSKIAAQAPNWAPGTNECYHSATFGYIVGEIVRRVDGRPIDRFIAEELAAPLAADYVLGCSDTDLNRVAPQIPNPENDLMGKGGLVNERSMSLFKGAPADPNYVGSTAFLKSVFPSGSGISNALGLARLFAPLASEGMADGASFFAPATVATALAEQWHHDDSIFGNEFRVAVGLNLHCGFTYYGREGNAGSAGGGGYTVFADPAHRITFAYTPNRFTTGSGLGKESRRLVDALYASLST